MPVFINPNNFTVHLVGPDGTSISIKGHHRKVLSEFYDKYVSRGFLRKADATQQPPQQTIAPVQKIQARIRSNKAKPKPDVPPPSVAPARVNVAKAKRVVMAAKVNKFVKPTRHNKQVVGKVVSHDASELIKANLDKNNYPISNGIGVGILSYNRASSLRRLVNSIINNTDLRRTTVFISDDNSDESATIAYLAELASNPNFIILRNRTRLGIAGNSNRLLRCLARFKHGLLLNDDVEVLASGWEQFYFTAMRDTNMHHLMYRQHGVYNADRGNLTQRGTVKLLKVDDKPHGAVLAFDHVFLEKVGYFNEMFGLYGMEHVDWSQRAWELNLQESGFFDVVGSDAYFKLYSENSTIQNRSKLLQDARAKFGDRKFGYIPPSDASIVPEIAYVVPFRDFERTDSIRTVINNLRAQRYPVINIIMAEQDNTSKINLDNYRPIEHHLVKSSGHLFNKSLAFNVGVSKVKCEMVILHDADMLAQGHYTQSVADILANYESCHIGKNVIYTTPESMQLINSSGVVDTNAKSDRVVGYYEGGSLACTRSAFWKVGGFNEDYKGYGCFLPGNYVLTDGGYKTIEAVGVNDKLYTHEGQYQSIELRQRSYQGQILDLYVPGRLPIKGVTPEHPFLVQTADDEFMWRRADALQLGDTIASTDHLPEFVPPYDLHDLTVLTKSNNRFDLTQHMNEFCYLLGLYLADGVLQTPDRLRTVYYYLSRDEEFLAKHVEKIVHDLHPAINVRYHYIKNNCREVRVFNSLLAKLIKAVAGRYTAINKIVSQKFVGSLTNVQISYLLGGGCDGDANHQNGSEQRLVYHTSSINLAMTYSGMMRRLGIAHSFGKRNGGSFPGSSEYTFDLCVNREFEHLIHTTYNKAIYFGSSSVGKSKFGKVYDIKRRDYDGPVYNFEVKDDHSYVVNGLIVHNCEDCDFYTRLSGASKWKELRSFDFLHLWHSRVSGWNNHHEANKALEASLKNHSVAERVALQQQQLARLNYQTGV